MKFIKKLFSNIKPFSNNVNGCLIKASGKNDLTMMKALIKSGHDVNQKWTRNITPLIGATVRGNFEAVKLLLKNGARVNDKDISGNSALCYAVCSNNVKIAKILIKYGANINNDTFLYICIKNNYLSMFNLLIKNNINIDLQDEKGQTAVMFAAFENKYKFLKVLIQNNADIYLKNNEGYSGLMYINAITGE